MERIFKLSKFGKVIDTSFFRCRTGWLWASELFENSYIKCSLVMVKSSVPPTKFLSVIRLELTSVALSIKVSRC